MDINCCESMTIFNLDDFSRNNFSFGFKQLSIVNVLDEHLFGVFKILKK